MPPKARIENYQNLLDPQFIKDVNCFITEERVRRPGKHNEKDMINNLGEFRKTMPNLDISKDDDYFKVINPGPLEGLNTNIGYKYGQEAEVMELVSYVVEYIAQNQIFGNGNKRTSFLIGYLILLTYQLANNFEEIYLPELNGELVDMISNVAIREKESDKQDLRDFMSTLEEKINQNWEK